MGLHHWLQLSLTKGLGPILIRRLIAASGSAESAVRMSCSDLQQVDGIGPAKAREIHASLIGAASDAETQLRKAGELKAQVICPDDAIYPELLRPIADAPVILYMLGDLQPRDLQSLAVVGSRRCSYYGREQAERFGSILAGAGLTVISGGARGIDSAAHRGAMRHPQGRTIAVLGSGLDVPYPPENEPLFREIAQRGAVISEMPFGSPPNAENFPRRNRIISGMSRGVLVIEADQRSGAMITARQANEEHGRPVFALPGRVDNRMSIGPHQLIRDGAILVTQLEDILTDLAPLPHSAVEPQARESDQPIRRSNAEPALTGLCVSLSSRQQTILEHLSEEPAAIDHLVDRCGLNAAIVLQELTFLTLKGAVKRVGGQMYARTAGPGR